MSGCLTRNRIIVRRVEWVRCRWCGDRECAGFAAGRLDAAFMKDEGRAMLVDAMVGKGVDIHGSCYRAGIMA